MNGKKKTLISSGMSKCGIYVGIYVAYKIYNSDSFIGKGAVII